MEEEEELKFSFQLLKRKSYLCDAFPKVGGKRGGEMEEKEVEEEEYDPLRSGFDMSGRKRARSLEEEDDPIEREADGVKRKEHYIYRL